MNKYKNNKWSYQDDAISVRWISAMQQWQVMWTIKKGDWSGCTSAPTYTSRMSQSAKAVADMYKESAE